MYCFAGVHRRPPDCWRRTREHDMDYTNHTVEPITLTVAETRKVSGLGTTTIYELIKQRKLKSVCIGRRRLVEYASLKTLLASGA